MDTITIGVESKSDTDMAKIIADLYAASGLDKTFEKMRDELYTAFADVIKKNSFVCTLQANIPQLMRDAAIKASAPPTSSSATAVVVDDPGMRDAIVDKSLLGGTGKKISGLLKQNHIAPKIVELKNDTDKTKVAIAGEISRITNRAIDMMVGA